MLNVEKDLDDTATSLKTKKKPTKHNIFVRKMISQLKNIHPKIDYKDRYKIANILWKKEKSRLKNK